MGVVAPPSLLSSSTYWLKPPAIYAYSRTHALEAGASLVSSDAFSKPKPKPKPVYNMPTIDIVRALRALDQATPTSNPARERLRAAAHKRAYAELQRRADAARRYVERLAQAGSRTEPA